MMFSFINLFSLTGATMLDKHYSVNFKNQQEPLQLIEEIQDNNSSGIENGEIEDKNSQKNQEIESLMNKFNNWNNADNNMINLGNYKALYQKNSPPINNYQNANNIISQSDNTTKENYNVNNLHEFQNVYQEKSNINSDTSQNQNNDVKTILKQNVFTNLGELSQDQINTQNQIPQNQNNEDASDHLNTKETPIIKEIYETLKTPKIPEINIEKYLPTAADVSLKKYIHQEKYLSSIIFLTTLNDLLDLVSMEVDKYYETINHDQFVERQDLTDSTMHQIENNQKTIEEETVANALKTKQEAEELEKQRRAEALKTKQEAEALKTKQEAEALKTKQEAEALKTKQEAEVLKKQRRAEALKTKQEAEVLKKQRRAEALKKQRIAEALKKQRIAEELEKQRIAEELEKQRIAEELEKQKNKILQDFDNNFLILQQKFKTIKETNEQTENNIKRLIEKKTQVVSTIDSIKIEDLLVKISTNDTMKAKKDYLQQKIEIIQKIKTYNLEESINKINSLKQDIDHQSKQLEQNKKSIESSKTKPVENIRLLKNKAEKEINEYFEKLKKTMIEIQQTDTNLTKEFENYLNQVDVDGLKNECKKIEEGIQNQKDNNKPPSLGDNTKNKEEIDELLKQTQNTFKDPLTQVNVSGLKNEFKQIEKGIQNQNNTMFNALDENEENMGLNEFFKMAQDTNPPKEFENHLNQFNVGDQNNECEQEEGIQNQKDNNKPSSLGDNTKNKEVIDEFFKQTQNTNLTKEFENQKQVNVGGLNNKFKQIEEEIQNRTTTHNKAIVSDTQTKDKEFFKQTQGTNPTNKIEDPLTQVDLSNINLGTHSETIEDKQQEELLAQALLAKQQEELLAQTLLAKQQAELLAKQQDYKTIKKDKLMVLKSLKRKIAQYKKDIFDSKNKLEQNTTNLLNNLSLINTTIPDGLFQEAEQNLQNISFDNLEHDKIKEILSLKKLMKYKKKISPYVDLINLDINKLKQQKSELLNELKKKNDELSAASEKQKELLQEEINLLNFKLSFIALNTDQTDTILDDNKKQTICDVLNENIKLHTTNISQLDKMLSDKALQDKIEPLIQKNKDAIQYLENTRQCINKISEMYVEFEKIPNQINALENNINNFQEQLKKQAIVLDNLKNDKHSISQSKIIDLIKQNKKEIAGFQDFAEKVYKKHEEICVDINKIFNTETKLDYTKKDNLSTDKTIISIENKQETSNKKPIETEKIINITQQIVEINKNINNITQQIVEINENINNITRQIETTKPEIEQKKTYYEEALKELDALKIKIQKQEKQNCEDLILETNQSIENICANIEKISKEDFKSILDIAEQIKTQTQTQTQIKVDSIDANIKNNFETFQKYTNKVDQIKNIQNEHLALVRHAMLLKIIQNVSKNNDQKSYSEDFGHVLDESVTVEMIINNIEDVSDRYKIQKIIENIINNREKILPTNIEESEYFELSQLFFDSFASLVSGLFFAMQYDDKNMQQEIIGDVINNKLTIKEILKKRNIKQSSVEGFISLDFLREINAYYKSSKLENLKNLKLTDLALKNIMNNVYKLKKLAEDHQIHQRLLDLGYDINPKIVKNCKSFEFDLSKQEVIEEYRNAGIKFDDQEFLNDMSKIGLNFKTSQFYEKLCIALSYMNIKKITPDILKQIIKYFKYLSNISVAHNFEESHDKDIQHILKNIKDYVHILIIIAIRSQEINDSSEMFLSQFSKDSDYFKYLEKIIKHTKDQVLDSMQNQNTYNSIKKLIWKLKKMENNANIQQNLEDILEKVKRIQHVINVGKQIKQYDQAKQQITKQKKLLITKESQKKVAEDMQTKLNNYNGSSKEQDTNKTNISYRKNFFNKIYRFFNKLQSIENKDKQQIDQMIDPELILMIINFNQFEDKYAEDAFSYFLSARMHFYLYYAKPSKTNALNYEAMFNELKEIVDYQFVDQDIIDAIKYLKTQISTANLSDDIEKIAKLQKNIQQLQTNLKNNVVLENSEQTKEINLQIEASQKKIKDITENADFKKNIFAFCNSITNKEEMCLRFDKNIATIKLDTIDNLFDESLIEHINQMLQDEIKEADQKIQMATKTIKNKEKEIKDIDSLMQHLKDLNKSYSLEEQVQRLVYEMQKDNDLSISIAKFSIEFDKLQSSKESYDHVKIDEENITNNKIYKLLSDIIDTADFNRQENLETFIKQIKDFQKSIFKSQTIIEKHQKFLTTNTNISNKPEITSEIQENYNIDLLEALVKDNTHKDELQQIKQQIVSDQTAQINLNKEKHKFIGRFIKDIEGKYTNMLKMNRDTLENLSFAIDQRQFQQNLIEIHKNIVNAIGKNQKFKEQINERLLLEHLKDFQNDLNRQRKGHTKQEINKEQDLIIYIGSELTKDQKTLNSEENFEHKEIYKKAAQIRDQIFQTTIKINELQTENQNAETEIVLFKRNYENNLKNQIATSKQSIDLTQSINQDFLNFQNNYNIKNLEKIKEEEALNLINAIKSIYNATKKITKNNELEEINKLQSTLDTLSDENIQKTKKQLEAICQKIEEIQDIQDKLKNKGKTDELSMTKYQIQIFKDPKFIENLSKDLTDIFQSEQLQEDYIAAKAEDKIKIMLKIIPKKLEMLQYFFQKIYNDGFNKQTFKIIPPKLYTIKQSKEYKITEPIEKDVYGFDVDMYEINQLKDMININQEELNEKKAKIQTTIKDKKEFLEHVKYAFQEDYIKNFISDKQQMKKALIDIFKNIETNIEQFLIESKKNQEELDKMKKLQDYIAQKKENNYISLKSENNNLIEYEQKLTSLTNLKNELEKQYNDPDTQREISNLNNKQQKLKDELQYIQLKLKYKENNKLNQKEKDDINLQIEQLKNKNKDIGKYIQKLETELTKQPDEYNKFVEELGKKLTKKEEDRLFNDIDSLLGDYFDALYEPYVKSINNLAPKKEDTEQQTKEKTAIQEQQTAIQKQKTEKLKEIKKERDDTQSLDTFSKIKKFYRIFGDLFQEISDFKDYKQKQSQSNTYTPVDKLKNFLDQYKDISTIFQNIIKNNSIQFLQNKSYQKEQEIKEITQKITQNDIMFLDLSQAENNVKQQTIQIKKQKQKIGKLIQDKKNRKKEIELLADYIEKKAKNNIKENKELIKQNKKSIASLSLELKENNNQLTNLKNKLFTTQEDENEKSLDYNQLLSYMKSYFHTNTQEKEPNYWNNLKELSKALSIDFDKMKADIMRYHTLIQLKQDIAKETDRYYLLQQIENNIKQHEEIENNIKQHKEIDENKKTILIDLFNDQIKKLENQYSEDQTNIQKNYIITQENINDEEVRKNYKILLQFNDLIRTKLKELSNTKIEENDLKNLKDVNQFDEITQKYDKMKNFTNIVANISNDQASLDQNIPLCQDILMEIQLQIQKDIDVLKNSETYKKNKEYILANIQTSKSTLVDKFKIFQTEFNLLLQPSSDQELNQKLNQELENKNLQNILNQKINEINKYKKQTYLSPLRNLIYEKSKKYNKLISEIKKTISEQIMKLIKLIKIDPNQKEITKTINIVKILSNNLIQYANNPYRNYLINRQTTETINKNVAMCKLLDVLGFRKLHKLDNNNDYKILKYLSILIENSTKISKDEEVAQNEEKDNAINLFNESIEITEKEYRQFYIGTNLASRPKSALNISEINNELLRSINLQVLQDKDNIMKQFELQTKNEEEQLKQLFEEQNQQLTEAKIEYNTIILNATTSEKNIIETKIQNITQLLTSNNFDDFLNLLKQWESNGYSNYKIIDFDLNDIIKDNDKQQIAQHANKAKFLEGQDEVKVDDGKTEVKYVDNILLFIENNKNTNLIQPQENTNPIQPQENTNPIQTQENTNQIQPQKNTNENHKTQHGFAFDVNLIINELIKNNYQETHKDIINNLQDQLKKHEYIIMIINTFKNKKSAFSKESDVFKHIYAKNYINNLKIPKNFLLNIKNICQDYELIFTVLDKLDVNQMVSNLPLETNNITELKFNIYRFIMPIFKAENHYQKCLFDSNQPNNIDINLIIDQIYESLFNNKNSQNDIKELSNQYRKAYDSLNKLDENSSISMLNNSIQEQTDFYINNNLQKRISFNKQIFIEQNLINHIDQIIEEYQKYQNNNVPKDVLTTIKEQKEIITLKTEIIYTIQDQLDQNTNDSKTNQKIEYIIKNNLYNQISPIIEEITQPYNRYKRLYQQDQQFKAIENNQLIQIEQDENSEQYGQIISISYYIENYIKKLLKKTDELFGEKIKQTVAAYEKTQNLDTLELEKNKFSKLIKDKKGELLKNIDAQLKELEEKKPNQQIEPTEENITEFITLEEQISLQKIKKNHLNDQSTQKSVISEILQIKKQIQEKLENKMDIIILEKHNILEQLNEFYNKQDKDIANCLDSCENKENTNTILKNSRKRAVKNDITLIEQAINSLNQSIKSKEEDYITKINQHKNKNNKDLIDLCLECLKLQNIEILQNMIQLIKSYKNKNIQTIIEEILNDPDITTKWQSIKDKNNEMIKKLNEQKDEKIAQNNSIINLAQGNAKDVDDVFKAKKDELEKTQDTTEEKFGQFNQMYTNLKNINKKIEDVDNEISSLKAEEEKIQQKLTNLSNKLKKNKEEENKIIQEYIQKTIKQNKYKIKKEEEECQRQKKMLNKQKKRLSQDALENYELLTDNTLKDQLTKQSIINASQILCLDNQQGIEQAFYRIIHQHQCYTEQDIKNCLESNAASIIKMINNNYFRTPENNNTNFSRRVTDEIESIQYKNNISQDQCPYAARLQDFYDKLSKDFYDNKKQLINKNDFMQSVTTIQQSIKSIENLKHTIYNKNQEWIQKLFNSFSGNYRILQTLKQEIIKIKAGIKTMELVISENNEKNNLDHIKDINTIKNVKEISNEMFFVYKDESITSTNFKDLMKQKQQQIYDKILNNIIDKQNIGQLQRITQKQAKQTQEIQQTKQQQQKTNNKITQLKKQLKEQLKEQEEQEKQLKEQEKQLQEQEKQLQEQEAQKTQIDKVLQNKTEQKLDINDDLFQLSVIFLANNYELLIKLEKDINNIRQKSKLKDKLNKIKHYITQQLEQQFSNNLDTYYDKIKDKESEYIPEKQEINAKFVIDMRTKIKEISDLYEKDYIEAEDIESLVIIIKNINDLVNNESNLNKKLLDGIKELEELVDEFIIPNQDIEEEINKLKSDFKQNMNENSISVDNALTILDEKKKNLKSDNEIEKIISLNQFQYIYGLQNILREKYKNEFDKYEQRLKSIGILNEAEDLNVEENPTNLIQQQQQNTQIPSQLIE